MKRLIHLLMIIGFSVPRISLNCVSFLTFFIDEAERKLVATRCGCSLVYKWRSGGHKTFLPTPIDARTKYAVFSFAKCTSILVLIIRFICVLRIRLVCVLHIWFACV